MVNNKKATILFHQGWTDVFNCLSLININSKIYEEVKVIMFDGSKNLIDFYISQFNNVSVDYFHLSQIDYNLSEIIKNYSDTELLIYGVNDSIRTDEYKNVFFNSFNNTFFVEKFYVCYGLDYFNRIEKFEFIRDTVLEDETYNKFTENYGKNYVLYHEDSKRGLFINKNVTHKDSNLVDLNAKTNVFFDYIKILEGAKEFHLLDSVWASFIYLLDSKYELFKNVKVNVHCLRGHQEMFLNPKKLENWNIF